MDHYKIELYKLFLVWEIHTHLKCNVMEEQCPSFHIQYPTKKGDIFSKLNFCMKTGNGNKIIYK